MVGFGVIVMFVAVITACIYWSNPENKGYTVGGCALAALGAMIALIGGTSSRDFDGSPALAGFGWIIVVVGAVLFFIGLKKNNEIKAEEAERANLEKKKQFYRKCVQEGVTDLATSQNRQKAELIARSTMGGYTNLEALFSEARELCNSADRIANEERIRKQREQEREDEREQAKYADYYGRDKRIAMLTDLMRKSTNDAEMLRKYATGAIGSTQQKESDWAILGGMASGLAGGAAGIATAADIQARNAQIRAQNAANLSRIAPAVVNVMEKSANLSQLARSYGEEIERAQIKLVSDKTGAQVMENLTLSDANVRVSETGAVTVSAKARLNATVQEFDGRAAVIDGTIDAIVSQDSREVARVKLVLPKDGIRSECKLRGIRCANVDAAKQCTIEFKPYKLWIMEA